jgi:hypothetical protein
MFPSKIVEMRFRTECFCYDEHRAAVRCASSCTCTIHPPRHNLILHKRVCLQFRIIHGTHSCNPEQVRHDDVAPPMVAATETSQTDLSLISNYRSRPFSRFHVLCLACQSSSGLIDMVRCDSAVFFSIETCKRQG